MIKYSLFLLLVAAIHAKVEIMIEGKDGWAKTLPCWRLNVFLTKLILGKEISGYHFYMGLLSLVLFHAPFLFISWTLKQEALTMGFFCWYWLAEDFLWFLENKHYGLKKFRKNCISWHKRWICGIPVSYFISIILGSILLYLGK